MNLIKTPSYSFHMYMFKWRWWSTSHISVWIWPSANCSAGLSIYYWWKNSEKLYLNGQMMNTTSCTVTTFVLDYNYWICQLWQCIVWGQPFVLDYNYWICQLWQCIVWGQPFVLDYNYRIYQLWQCIVWGQPFVLDYNYRIYQLWQCIVWGQPLCNQIGHAMENIRSIISINGILYLYQTIYIIDHIYGHIIDHNIDHIYYIYIRPYKYNPNFCMQTKFWKMQ